MPKHYYLNVYSVEVDEIDGAKDIVSVVFNGDLKPKTKKAIDRAFVEDDYQLVMQKKVLA